MGLNFGEIASASGSFFKGEDFNQAVALLVEVKQLSPQEPTKFGPKDTIVADITAFGSVEGIGTDEGTVTKDVKIQAIDLVNKLRHLVNGATVVTVEKLPSSAKLPNGAWVWRAVDAEIRAAVVGYSERREAAGEAAAEELPDFSA